MLNRKKGESNTFDNIKKDRGKNYQQLKHSRKLHQEAEVSEGPCAIDELDKFHDYLVQQGYKLIVVCA